MLYTRSGEFRVGSLWIIQSTFRHENRLLIWQLNLLFALSTQVTEKIFIGWILRWNLWGLSFRSTEGQNLRVFRDLGQRNSFNSNLNRRVASYFSLWLLSRSSCGGSAGIRRIRPLLITV